MSNRSRAAYYSQVERVYSHCAVCRATGARTAKDGKTLCKECRAKTRRDGSLFERSYKAALSGFPDVNSYYANKVGE